MAIPARRAGRQAEVARLLLAVALTGGGGVGAACANMAEPPGGPPDSTPPHILSVRPESGAVVTDLKGDAVVEFTEVVDEMASGGGGPGAGAGVTGIGRQIILSPVAGQVHVSWHRKSVHVRPAEGWKPGRVYHLEILPGIPDLRRNIMKKGQTIVFSTGPALPHAALSGTALQWMEQRVLAKAVIRAAPLPDTVAYVTLADSTGAFSLTEIPAARYRVWAIQDQNGNRQLDPHEAFDTVTVTVDSTASVVLWAFVHDTAGPRLRGVDPIDSLAFRLQFSQPLDPHHKLDTARVQLLALPDSTPVPLEGMWSAVQFDSIQARARTAADSLRRAKDTTAARRDTVAQRPPVARRGVPTAARLDSSQRADTARIRQLLRQRPVPNDRFVARAAKPLTPGAKYLVRVRAATNLSGRAASSEAVLVLPVPKPAAASRDTNGASPSSRPAAKRP